ncbi:hypothetical protein AB3R30_19255 [Leptolyngbyaceae cyanobacterium UHCC 1019]
MSINKYQSHILVLPEDDANRQIANGFILHPNLNGRAIQVLPSAGGWGKVLNDLKDVHAPEMQKYLYRMMVLLIDFDNQQEERLSYVKNQIPQDLTDRVFVLGVVSEPENLRKIIQRTFENIGEALSQDCSDDMNELWGHDLLKHNQPEVERMILSVKPFLFEKNRHRF